MHREPPSTLSNSEDQIISKDMATADPTNKQCEIGTTEDHRFAPLADVRFRAVLDEGVVIRQQAAEVLVVNAVGVRILELIGEDCTVGSMVDVLLQEFSVKREELHKDVLAFTSELERAGVVERVAVGSLP